MINRSIERVTRKLDILKIHRSKTGQPYDEIACSVLGHILLTPEAMNSADFVESCHDLAERGFQHVIVNMPNLNEIRPLKTIGQEIIPQVSDL
jgi:hypothetical protein